MNPHSRFAATAAALLLSAGAAPAATLQVTSRDPAGIGFNDATPVAPVGGNPGTTLGDQRMNVYRYVAGLWGNALASTVVITVNAGWESLACTTSSAVLGSAGPWNLWHDFTGGKPGTWYPAALANKLAGENLAQGLPDDGTGYANVDIKTQFNIDLGKTGCLDGSTFYLGLDGNAGGQINFVEVLEHELGHGLGFGVNAVDAQSGWRLEPTGRNYVASGGLPDVWEGFLYDNTAAKTWLAMTNVERQASAVNPQQVGWMSPRLVAAARATLGPLRVIQVGTPAPSGSGWYAYGTAAFGAPVVSGTTFGALVTATSLNGAGAACSTLDPATAAAVRGKVAIVDRGGCNFTVKAKNAQLAGAVGLMVANNASGVAPSLGGTDATVVIPVVSVSQNDGVTLKVAASAAGHYGSRTKPGVASSAFTSDPTRLSGADAAGRPLLYTPNPFVPGSSVSHWDTSAFPNLLMEPNINTDLTTALVPPNDLTRPLLNDLGW